MKTLKKGSFKGSFKSFDRSIFQGGFYKCIFFTYRSLSDKLFKRAKKHEKLWFRSNQINPNLEESQ